jgi:hypothetical protein
MQKERLPPTKSLLIDWHLAEVEETRRDRHGEKKTGEGKG